MGSKPNHVDVIIVVSGAPQPVSINIHERLEHAVREALRGNPGQAPEEWELRSEDGVLIDQEQRPGEAGVTDGQTLFLNPRAGAGG